MIFIKRNDGSSLLWLDFVLEHEIAADPEDKKETQEAHDVQPKHALVQGQLFEELLRVLEVAVGLGALQGPPVEAVDGQHCAFEAVAGIGHVAHPVHVERDVLQGHKEAWKDKIMKSGGFLH